jgi:hypothetical protein
MTFNSSGNGITLYVDGSSVGTGTLTGTLQSSAGASLNFGGTGGASPVATNPLLVDQAGFWKGRVLSAGDVTALYNSGSGLSWAAMA